MNTHRPHIPAQNRPPWSPHATHRRPCPARGPLTKTRQRLSLSHCRYLSVSIDGPRPAAPTHRLSTGTIGASERTAESPRCPNAPQPQPNTTSMRGSLSKPRPPRHSPPVPPGGACLASAVAHKNRRPGGTPRRRLVMRMSLSADENRETKNIPHSNANLRRGSRPAPERREPNKMRRPGLEVTGRRKDHHLSQRVGEKPQYTKTNRRKQAGSLTQTRYL